MSADLLRRAAAKLRDDRVPDGPWEFAPVDPRPNFELFIDPHIGGVRVVELNWGREDPALPDVLASLLSARPALADWLDKAAEIVAGYSPEWADRAESLFPECFAVARAILREAS